MHPTLNAEHAIKSPIVHGWSAPGRFEPLKDWLRDLEQINNGSVTSELTWEIVGRAVLITNGSYSYCKKIIRQMAQASGYQLKEIATDQVLKFFADELAEIHLPTMLVMPLGTWSADVEDFEDVEEIIAFQRNFVEMLAAIHADRNIVIVSYGDDPINLVDDLQCAGAFDRRFVIDNADLHERGIDFFDLLPPHICGETLLANPELIGQVLDHETDHERRAGLIALALKRLACREARQVQYADFLKFTLQGTAEFMQNIPRKKIDRNIAVHEAGHALISIIDSAGENIPDYAGIVPSIGKYGQVSRSYSYIASLSSPCIYKYRRHAVRELLAGRAAEQLLLGIENISTSSAGGDLQQATNIAKNLVSRSGFSPTMEDETTAGSNLLIKNSVDISEAEKSRIEEAARLFLSRQYDIVLTLLRTHQKFLEVVVEQLLEHRTLDKAKLQALAFENGAITA